MIFNRHLLLPSGTKVILYAKPTIRSSWVFYGGNSWYIGPVTSYYRRITCYIPKTQGKRIIETAKTIPNHIPILQALLDDHSRATVSKLVRILHRKYSPISVK